MTTDTEIVGVLQAKIEQLSITNTALERTVKELHRAREMAEESKAISREALQREVYESVINLLVRGIKSQGDGW